VYARFFGPGRLHFCKLSGNSQVVAIDALENLLFRIRNAPCLENILSVHPDNDAGTWTLNFTAKAMPNQGLTCRLSIALNSYEYVDTEFQTAVSCRMPQNGLNRHSGAVHVHSGAENVHSRAVHVRKKSSRPSTVVGAPPTI
jgi:hypothetical protein